MRFIIHWPEQLFTNIKQEISGKGYIAVVSAGTSDLPVAEEAVETARFLNNEVVTVYDVGVAGRNSQAFQ